MEVISKIIDGWKQGPVISGTASNFGRNTTEGSTTYVLNAQNPSSNTVNSARLSNSGDSSSAKVCGGYYYISKLTSIPNNAIIKNVACRIKYYISSATNITDISIQLYSGSTAKGTPITYISTNSSGVNRAFTDPGTWSATDLNNNEIRIEIKATHRANNTTAGYVYIYGIDFTVTYEVPTEIKLLKYNGTTVQNVVYNGHNVNKFDYAGNVVFQKDPKDYYKTIPLTFEILTSGTISLARNNTSSGTSWSIEYSINGGTHSTVTGNNGTTKQIATVSAGDIFTIHSLSRLYSSSSAYSYFSTTCNFNVYGNLMTSMNSGTMTTYLCYYLFKNCTGLISAENLILPDTVANYCYYYMFYGCTNLTKAPSLPAITLANSCYYGMFSGCTSLTTAPELPAPNIGDSSNSSLDEYNYMFNGCSNLNYIKCLLVYNNFGPANSLSFSNWLYNASSTGTFVRPKYAQWQTGTNGIPSGWTVQEI